MQSRARRRALVMLWGCNKANNFVNYDDVRPTDLKHTDMLHSNRQFSFQKPGRNNKIPSKLFQRPTGSKY
jgi:hypothetical protein